jgi:hypothetical protein
MADVNINKRVVLVSDKDKLISLPPNTASPTNPISPDVEVDFLQLVDTPESYEDEANNIPVVGDDEDQLVFKSAEDWIFDRDSKATPIALDRIVISDSEDGDKLKVVTGVPLTMLGQGGAISGQAIVWDGAKWAAATVSGSKWTEVTNGIYRNGRVAIGTTTVGTENQLSVRRLSGSDNIFALITAAGVIKLSCSDTVLAVGGASQFDWRGSVITAGVGIGVNLAIRGANNEFIGNFTHNGANAIIDLGGIPTSDPLVAGRLWNDSTTLRISAG